MSDFKQIYALKLWSRSESSADALYKLLIVWGVVQLMTAWFINTYYVRAYSVLFGSILLDVLTQILR